MAPTSVSKKTIDYLRLAPAWRQAGAKRIHPRLPPMAQEDKGLVLRGLILLGAMGVLVPLVLGVIFWRPHAPPPSEMPAGLADLMPSAPGWEVRYNAATTLARRGSASVPWALLREMLDEKQQLVNSRLREENGADTYDVAAAHAYMLSALKALAA